MSPSLPLRRLTNAQVAFYMGLRLRLGDGRWELDWELGTGELGMEWVGFVK